MRTILLLFLGLAWSGNIRAQNITAVEYFVDTDPGYGLATPVSGFVQSAIVEDVKFTVPMGSVPAGVHRIFVRSKDDLGAWSFVSSHMFFRESIPASPPNLTRLEYFIDTDPGYGVATEIPITGALDVNDRNFTIPVDALSAGVHRIFVRARNSTGNWSVVSSHLFFKELIAASAPDLVRLEYFIDQDPGYGLATEVSIATGQLINKKTFAIPVTSLAYGLHRIFLRAKDASGGWSVVSSHLFFKENIADIPPDIDKIEFFVDQDPGYGLGVDVPFSSGTREGDKNLRTAVQTLTNFEIFIPEQEYEPGIHYLFIRVRDTSGAWSMMAVEGFEERSLPVTLLNFTAQKLETSVNLLWTTTEENNSDHFDIEHSVEGKNWERIGSLKANGESINAIKYTFVDPTPASGINLYRLKMVDKDATFAYSRIVSVEFLSEGGITLFPNPAREHINILSNEPISSFKMMAADGKVILENSGLNESKTLQLKFGSAQPGIYILQFSLGNDKIETRKVIVE